MFEVTAVASDAGQLRARDRCVGDAGGIDLQGSSGRSHTGNESRSVAGRRRTCVLAATGGRFELTDTNAPAIAGICSRLDGLALAIELVASRVGTHGIAETADLLAGGLGLDWRGRRTAHPRHQTLRALLDWSYGSLGELERIVFRGLSIFVGTFTLDAVRAVCCGNIWEEGSAISAFDGLVAKCLASASVPDDNITRYRLLETTRAYALEKLEESSERQATARRHAAYFARLLDDACGGEVDPHQDSRAPSPAEHLGNVRACKG